MSDGGWAVSGVSRTAAAPGPAADVVALRAAVDEAPSVVPVALPPEVAAARAEDLLALQERVSALALVAVADVDARELWRSRSAGSSRGWLRTLPCGDRGQVALARLLEARPVLAGALAAGEVSVRTAGVVARELARVPAHVEVEQLAAVLVDGVGDLLGVWAGAACLDPTAVQESEFEARRELLSAAVRRGSTDCWSDAAGQLEPAFVLAATVLAPAEVESGLRLLVDALQPAPDADALGEREHRSRGLSLRKLAGGGWSLRAHLTDEVGELLLQALQVREDGHPLQKARATRAAARAAGAEDVCETGDEPDSDVSVAASEASGSGVEDASGAGESDPDTDTDTDVDGSGLRGEAGPGVPLATAGRAEEGTPLASVEQRAHDALARLLGDLESVRPGSGVPAPGHLTFTSSRGALDGQPGARPGWLVTSKGDVVLTPGRLRRHGCTSVLHAVLLDAEARPVGASGQHRHANRRERRAMRAATRSPSGERW